MGCVGYFGVKWNSVAAVAPFLLLGIGVDDMFVITRAYELTDPGLSVEDRISKTMRTAGTAIFFTSITDLLAFLIGATGQFESINSFCIVSGLGVFLDFVFCCSLFLGFLT